MNLKKFKELSFKQKIVWLLQYYGLTALAVAVGIFVAVIFIKSIFFPEPVEDICVLVLSDVMTQDEAYDFQEEIANATGKTVLISAFDNSDVYGKQAFSMKVTANQIDIIVSPKEETELMAQNGYVTYSEELSVDNLCICKTIRTREEEYVNSAYNMVKEWFLK